MSRIDALYEAAQKREKWRDEHRQFGGLPRKVELTDPEFMALVDAYRVAVAIRDGVAVLGEVLRNSPLALALVAAIEKVEAL